MGHFWVDIRAKCNGFGNAIAKLLDNILSLLSYIAINLNNNISNVTFYKIESAK